MRIYINNLNIELLKEYTKCLTKYNYEIIQLKNIYTSNGIYQIKEDKIYNLNPFDQPIEIFYNYYEKLTFISDTSFYKITETTSILGETHVCNDIVQYNYKLIPDDEIKLVIQFCKDTKKNILTPLDLYFESEHITNINEVFIKNKLCKFIDIILEL